MYLVMNHSSVLFVKAAEVRLNGGKMKVLVAHPFQQHSYRLATALKKSNLLYKYITPVYNKKLSFTRFITYFLPKKYKNRANTRRCDFLDDDDVLLFCEIEGLIRLLSQNIRFFNKFHNRIKYHLTDKFAKKVASYAIRNNVDIVVCYDDCSSKLFSIIKNEAPNIKCILDVSAANRLFMKEIYDKDLELAPCFSCRLKKEVGQIWDKDLMLKIKNEIQLADYYLVPSDFVSKSLVYSGVDEKFMLRCPYGVDLQLFDKKNDYISTLPLKFIYIGGVKELKGIYYLLEAFKLIPKELAELIIVGDFDDSDDIKPYGSFVTFTGRILHTQIPNILRKADVFIMPSLGEGLSLSSIEAAACGLPLLVSENSGIDCFIENYKEGVIFPIQSIKEIYNGVMWFINHKDQIEMMGNNSRKLAEQFSWNNYYNLASNKIASIK